MVPLNMTYPHCLQHSLFEHLFNLYMQVFILSLNMFQASIVHLKI